MEKRPVIFRSLPSFAACHSERSEGSGEPTEPIQSSRSEPALERSEGMTGGTPVPSALGKLLSIRLDIHSIP